MDLLKKILKRKDAVFVISMVLLVTKILGFVKFRIIAGSFGASQELDIFWAAFLIPDTLFNILIAGSVNAAVIPVFSDVLYERGEKSLVKLLLTTLALVGIVGTVLSVILIFFSPYVSDMLVNSWFISESYNLSSELGQQGVDQLTLLMQIMLLSPILLALSSILSAFLQVHKQFFITTLAPFVYNFGMIFGSIIFVTKLGWGVEGLAWAVIIASILHFAVQLPIAYQFIHRELHIKRIKGIAGEVHYYSKEVWRMIKLAVPRIIAYIGEQFNVVFNTVIAFSLTAGALSAYRFAISLQLFPVHIISGAIAQIALPNFAEAFSKDNIPHLVKLYNEAMRKTMFLILPSVMIIVVLRLPIVRLTYGTGKFDWWDTVVTSWALALLGFAIIGQSAVALTLRAMYAIHETKLPLLVTFITVAVNIAASYYFTNFFSHYLDWRPIFNQVLSQVGAGASEGGASGIGPILLDLWGDLGVWFTTRNVYDAAVGGLALSLSLAFMVEAILNMYFLNRKISFMSREDLVKPIFKMLVNSTVMAGAMYLVFRFSDFSLDTSRTFSVFVVLVVTASVGAVTYLSMSALTGVGEVRLVTYYIKAIAQRTGKSLGIVNS